MKTTNFSRPLSSKSIINPTVTSYTYEAFHQSRTVNALNHALTSDARYADVHLTRVTEQLREQFQYTVECDKGDSLVVFVT